MAIFRPPTDNFVRPTLAENFTKGSVLSQEQRLANRLASHYVPGARGRNVFLLTNGTFTENEPSDMDTVAKVYYGGARTSNSDIQIGVSQLSRFMSGEIFPLLCCAKLLRMWT